MKDFRELIVWQRAHQVVLKVYKVTKSFPKKEMFGLTSQMRRAGISVAANIAEGCGRKTDADLRRFLVIAFGSGNELEYPLLLSHDLGILRDSDYSSISNELTEVKKMLNSFIRKLTASS